MPHLTEPPATVHRPAVLSFTASGHPVTVVAEVAEAPKVHTTLDVSTLTARSTVQAGPLALIIDDPATARLWAAALELLADDLDLAAAHAAELRHTETEAATS